MPSRGNTYPKSPQFISLDHACAAEQNLKVVRVEFVRLGEAYDASKLSIVTRQGDLPGLLSTSPRTVEVAACLTHPSEVGEASPALSMARVAGQRCYVRNDRGAESRGCVTGWC